MRILGWASPSELVRLTGELSAAQALSEARLEAIQDVHMPEIRYLREQLEKKDEQLVNMVQEGYTPQIPVKYEVEVPKLPPEVMKEIDNLAEPRSGHWMELVREAEAELKADDATPEMVAAGIRQGGDFDPYA